MQHEREQPDDSRSDEDSVPIFGSWRRIYLAVLLNALLVMALIAAFSAGRW